MAAALTIADINTKVNHEPRMMDLRLADALEFSDRHKVRELINRHRPALERFGSLAETKEKPAHRGGRPGTAFWLNKRQALYLCTKSDTPNATEVTIQMVEVFDTWSSGQLPLTTTLPALPAPDGPLTLDNIFNPVVYDRIRQRARELAEASIPRLEHELMFRFRQDLMLGEINFEEHVLRTSILKRWQPGSEKEEQYLAGQWAWEIVPNTGDTVAREELETAIKRIVRASIERGPTPPQRMVAAQKKSAS